MVARELVLAYHNIFTLDSNELSCTSAIEHEIRIYNSKPFKERFRCIPPPLLEEVHPLLWDMLDAGTICLSQSPQCNVVVLVRKKDSALILDVSTHGQRRIHTLIQEVFESMVGSAHFPSMDFKSSFWQIKMAPDSQQYTAFMVGTLRFYKFICMPFGLCNAPGTFQCLM